MNYTQFCAIDNARAEADKVEAQLEDCQAAFNALAENAASAYAVLGAVILAKMPEEAARYSGCTPAQMCDGLVQELGEDELIEALTSAL